jgi:hypothetical protein
MTAWWILLMCLFMTVISIWKPNMMWGLLCAISWMLLFWWTRSNVMTGFALGDFGDTILISICIGAAVFTLIYTNIKVREQRIEQSDKELNESGGKRESGSRETSNNYYERLDRLTHPKKK